MSEPVTIVSQSPQVRSLFNKFYEVNNPIVSEFVNSIPEKFADAVSQLVSENKISSDFILRNRTRLKSVIRKFHTEAGTLTENVKSNIDLLDGPTTKIVVSTHQPNLFAYGGIYKKIVMLETLKDMVEQQDVHTKIVNLFLIVDHDFVDESWIRVAQLPSMQHSSGIMELRVPISESKRWQMVCNYPVPTQSVVHNWKRQIKSWVKNTDTKTDKNILMDNLEKFWQHVDASYARSKWYADLNSFIMSRVVNETWNYSTLFVRLSELSEVFENGYAFLISNHSIYSDALKNAENIFMSHGIDTGISPSSHLNAPLWVHCKCGSKASAKITRTSDNLVIGGTCMACKSKIGFDLGNPDSLELGNTIHEMSPRAIPIPLLLTRDLGISCYASGVGGIGYLVDGRIVSKKLGLNLPLVLIWSSKDVYQGIGQEEAQNSTNIKDIHLYIQNLKSKEDEYEQIIRPLLSKRTETIKNRIPADNLLSQLFELKEGQRRIREEKNRIQKIKTSLELSPCFVDYAVNFGMIKTQLKWQTHLVKDGRLASPVIF